LGRGLTERGVVAFADKYDPQVMDLDQHAGKEYLRAAGGSSVLSVPIDWA